MSLYNFHVVLISAAILFSFGLGAWAVEQHARVEGAVLFWTAAGSFAIGVALILYLVWFIRNIKRTHPSD